MMRIDAITTFPGMFDSVMGSSIMKRAQEKGILEFEAHDLRNWTYDVHRTTDDKPYGGGHGLVMKCEPVFEALEEVLGIPSGILAGQSAAEAIESAYSHIRDYEPDSAQSAYSEAQDPDASGDATHGFGEAANTRVIMASPHGRPFDDDKAAELSALDRLVFVCGHYEGMDERIYSAADEIISIGDYVLTSGELSSMVIIDAIVRKIPGVIGAERGAEDESFHDGLLEHPQYTRPSVFRGMQVPDVLLSGNHARIDEWRRDESLKRTRDFRPDLLER